jgi:acid phosphatase (class A)
MKKPVLLTLVGLFALTISFGQKSAYQRSLTPARGHYKQLATYSSKSKPGSEVMDKLKFESSQETIDRRLRLTPIYLKNVSIDDFNLPEVPANSSEQTRAELNYLLALQQRRTDESIRASLYMADVYYNLNVQPDDARYSYYRNNLFHIGRSIGSWFNPETLPVTADFIARVWRDASYFIWSYKFKYARVRPVVLDSSIKNLQETDWPAYPSGHASNSYINAYIYQELAPEFTDVFIKDAYDMAHSREIIGVHYPSDSETARIFARQFVNKLFQNEQFLKDFDLVKQEWAAKAKETFVKP